MAKTWLDTLREWNYDLAPVSAWLWDAVLYNAERHGPIAYVVAALSVILLFLSFPPTRGLTKTVCSSAFKMVVTYVQLVGSLLTVQLVGAIARISLTLFHKCRIWIGEHIDRARQKE